MLFHLNTHKFEADSFFCVRARTAALDLQASKKQCRRSEGLFLIDILQIEKTVAERLNNLSKINNNGVVAEFKFTALGWSLFVSFFKR